MQANCSHQRMLIRDLPQMNSDITRQFLTGNAKQHAASPIRNVWSWSLLRLKGQRMSSKETSRRICQGSVQQNNTYIHHTSIIHAYIHAYMQYLSNQAQATTEVMSFMCLGHYARHLFVSALFVFCCWAPYLFLCYLFSLVVTPSKKKVLYVACICMSNIRHTSQTRSALSCVPEWALLVIMPGSIHICLNAYKHIDAHYSFLSICDYWSGLLMGIYLHWLVMVTGTMIGVAYVYLSASLVIVGHLPMLCLNDAYLLSVGVALDDWCCLPTVLWSTIRWSGIWRLPLSACWGPTGRGAVLCFCTVCTQIHLSRCDRSRYALLIGNENDSKLGHSDLSVTWIRSSLIRRFWICCS